MMKVLATGLVYRNPKPYLRSIHAWHPSLARMTDGTLAASFDLGEAVESLDYRTYLARSTDEGAHWTEPAPIFTDVVTRRTSHSVRVGRAADGTLIAMGGRFYRDNPGEGLVNRKNLGYVEMDVIVLTSADAGVTWKGPHTVASPIVGPSFETCHAVIELPDGRWLWPTSTWRGWNGEEPNGMKAVAFVSRDRGRTWPEYLTVMDQYAQGLFSWEQSIVRLADGRLLAAVWAFDEPKGVTRGVFYALSADGHTFGAPRQTDLAGETTKILALPDGRVFAAYRGTEPAGLGGALVQIKGDQWITQERAPLYGGAATRMFGHGVSTDELSNLKLGYPQSVLLPNGDIFMVFWCCEDGVYNIRWLRIAMA